MINKPCIITVLSNSLYYKNMKNKLMDIGDKILLGKRAMIEAVNNMLKNTGQVEHSRHRSVHNFVVNVLGAIAAYSFLPHKPSIRAKSLFSILPKKISFGKLVKNRRKNRCEPTIRAI